MRWIENLDDQIIQKRTRTGALIIIAPCLGNEFRDSPEEFVRQSFIQYMHEKFGYEIGLLHLEFPMNVGSALKVRADVLWEGNELNPKFIAEIKKGNLARNEETIEQLKSYMLLSQVEIGCAVDAEEIIWMQLENGILSEKPEADILKSGKSDQRWLKCKNCHHVWSMSRFVVRDENCPECGWHIAYRSTDGIFI